MGTGVLPALLAAPKGGLGPVSPRLSVPSLKKQQYDILRKLMRGSKGQNKQKYFNCCIKHCHVSLNFGVGSLGLNPSSTTC